MPDSRVVELDVLRGFAILFMLVNHYAAYLLHSSQLESGVIGLLFFISSFAPVVFFFVTGFGYGLSYECGKQYTTLPVLYKAGILIIMDAFMRGVFDFFQAWDFLAFIGFSMLILHALRITKHAVVIAFVMMLFLFFYRYLLPNFLSIEANSEFNIISNILGVSKIEGVSYWFAPWLIYPFLGFFLGALQRKHKQSLANKKTSQLLNIFYLFAGVLIILCSLILWKKYNAGYFRWGTMSANYFIFSIGLILLLRAITTGISTVEKLVGLLSISGVSSLAVVPIHYFILHQYANWEGPKGYVLWFLSSLLVFVAFSVFSAKKVDFIVNNAWRDIHSNLLKGCVLIIIIAAFIVSYTGGNVLTTMVVLSSQLILCLLISKPYQKVLTK